LKNCPQLQEGGIPEECVPREVALKPPLPLSKGKVSEGTPRKRVKKTPKKMPDDGRGSPGRGERPLIT